MIRTIMGVGGSGASPPRCTEKRHSMRTGRPSRHGQGRRGGQDRLRVGRTGRAGAPGEFSGGPRRRSRQAPPCAALPVLDLTRRRRPQGGGMLSAPKRRSRARQAERERMARRGQAGRRGNGTGVAGDLPARGPPTGAPDRHRPESDLTAPPRRRAVVLYHFELQMAGVVLLTAMAAGGVSLWLKRRRERAADEERVREDAERRSREVMDGARAGGVEGEEQTGADPQPNK